MELKKLDEENSCIYDKKIHTLFKFETEYSADSVEWCPHDPHKSIFLCANYQLQESDDSSKETKCNRTGRILVWSISPKEGLTLLQTINTAAVLDQKWCLNKVDGIIIVGVVNANKTLEIYKLEEDILQLKLLTSHQIESSDSNEILMLSLDWSTAKYTSKEPEIICSDSKGNVHLLKFTNNCLFLLKTLHCHEYEAWTAGFYVWDPNVFFTGGDDSVLCKFDKRCGDIAIAKNRSHSSGVTCLQSNIKKEFIFASGSYDDHLRIWDVRNFKNPINLIKMPGSLWRIKWDPVSFEYLLTACMYGGAHIVNAKDINNIEISSSYLEHKKIVYGADWSFLNFEEVEKYDSEGNFIVATCSFYDNLLCISKTFCDIL